MQLSNQRPLEVSRDEAWQALNDIAILRACIPGCDAFDEVGEGRYQVGMVAAVGPVKARFTGQLVLSDRVPPESYRLTFEGRGGAAGHGKGSAHVRLEATGARRTVLHYSANASVGGKLAQIGQRLIDMTAQRMAADFFNAFDAQLRSRYATPEPEAAAPVDVERPTLPVPWWPRLRSWWQRVWA